MKKNIYILLYIIGLLNYTTTYSQVSTNKSATTQAIIDPDNCTDPMAWYFDNDGDGYGNPNNYLMACIKPVGSYVANSLDCNDNNVEITIPVWYYDKDNDGFGDPGYPAYECNQPLNYVANSLDCNDNNSQINPNTKWYVDTNGDGIISELDTNFITSCTKPNGNYIVLGTDSSAHWIHNVSFDTKGNIVGSSRTYFDDLGKSDVSLSKDYVTNKIWGTETTFDDFGRPDKTSFIAPSPLTTFDKINFFKSNSQVQADSYPTILPLPNISTSKIYKASESISATGTVSSGLTVSLIAPSITLGNTFTVTATAGSSFIVTAAILPDVSANPSLANYYSDNNTDEPYQATATHPFAQNNYDQLNPGNVINIVGGNKINNEWKTGYSFTVPAAQEMYYVYGSDYYDGAITSGKEEVITKFYKSVSVDANGIENVAFSDGEGKVLATARSGGSTSYPVVSLIGAQGFVDVHIPAGITSGISLIGNASLYKIYDLKTGLITSTLIGGNAYRIEAVTPPTTDPKTYISAGLPIYDTGALGITYRVNYYDYAVNIYNKTGQLIKSVQPNGYTANSTIVGTPAHMTSINFASTYTYNTLGQLIEASSPDEGISKFVYRKDGQIRYSQSALQRINNEISYTNYDGLSRPIESGVIIGNTGIWTSAVTAVDNNATVVGTNVKERTFSVYDYTENVVTDPNLLPTAYSLTIPISLSLAALMPAYTNLQNNLSGNVAVSYKVGSDNIINAITWYSYDLYGRTEWVVQYNEGIGAKTIHYEYDYKGNVKKVLFQKDKTAELFIHQYTYNANDALTKVETSVDNSTFITHADYSYYKTGELKRVNIAQGAQGLDYVYTLGGQLKSINHPSLEAAKDPGGDNNDVFGLALDYYNGDYLRTGRNIISSPTAGADYNGNIKAARWANKGITGDYSGSTANQKGYLYNYDRNNWLTGATFGNTNSATAVISPTPNLAEGGLTYDPNGNIKTLQRTNESGTVVDNLTYNYTNTGKNQLNSVTESAPVTADINDIENQSSGNYVYDAIGQLTQNISENLFYFYNVQGLVTEVKKGTNTAVKFFYNERGQRIKKESYNTSSPYALQATTFYQLDLSGNTMAVYNLPNSGSIVQTDLPIFGLSRLGVYNRASTMSNYEITDNLGNVRAVIQKISGQPVIQSYADYYPFGEQLPSRNSLSNYRYAFQGQELDKETGMEAFQLRLWDGRLGRWLSTDPNGQYNSPYLGMGNNPISRIDPDGGEDFYEKLDANGKGTGQYEWFDGSDDIEGYEHLGVAFNNSDTGAWGESRYGNIVSWSKEGGFFHHDYSLDEIFINNTYKGGGNTSYNVDNAVDWLDTNSHSSYATAEAKGNGARCAYFVRMALEAGGINTANHPVAARSYGPYLRNWGFNAVATDNFIKGDIAVIQGYTGGTADANGVPYGHIQMYNGKIWQAAFKQNGFWPGGGYRKNKPSFEIYRMPKK
ncbi:RHS repeat-associated core domain-containing protein [Flavobacterium sp. MC2016-06]|uniref:RHS repeat domain-containing protein n=1 Tax=Flavobacterium sp. MC2016-06 TaxID=2676308 RepID=UPI0018ACF8C8|nr:RHS repeat-associated core domain-containing protein [Flavobacterium sp. MC2016-06]MBU3858453.1 RHS repeat-associated core domain-containing protein [Flavobacterium sp. MC2016-06]